MSNDYRFVADESGIRALFEGPSSAVGKYQEQIAKKVTQLAKALCPVDTGTLRDSIAYTIDGDTIEVSAGTDYAIYVEMGTRNMSAQPFLRPAIGAIGGNDIDE